MTTMTQVQDAVRSVQDTAEQIKNDAMQFFPEAASVGDYVRQGDVYITLLKSIPRGSLAVKNPPLQLAEGNTQGSRHCLASAEGVTAYRLKEPTEYDGPILKLDCPNVIAHPEHGDWTLPPGVYGITYQRTVDSENRIRRVLD